MKIYLFDVDGTLTLARQPMPKDFAEFFVKFCEGKEIYLSTGSDFEKLVEQVPYNVLRACRGAFTCSGNVYHAWRDDIALLEICEDLNYRNDFEPPPELLLDLRCLLESSDCPVKTSNHIEERTGMINFSVVGRDCTQEQREEYAAWDKENGEREKIVSVLRKKYADLTFNIGGQISIDISPVGCDKSRSIPYLRKWHPGCSIHFYGDKMQPGGNDYPVLKELRERDTHEDVESYKHTWKLLDDKPEDGGKYAMSNIRELIAEVNPDALLADGLNEAIVGYGGQHPMIPVAVYDYDKCVEIFMRDNDWDWEGAIEWMEFNVVQAYLGPGTPIFMNKIDDDWDVTPYGEQKK